MKRTLTSFYTSDLIYPDHNAFSHHELYQKQPRKRAKLDYLTEEEKVVRRKLLNREAAQKARDRKKDLIEYMEKSISHLTAENQMLRSANRTLKQNFEAQEAKISRLEKQFAAVLKRVEASKVNKVVKESAELLSQQQRVTLGLNLLHLLWIAGKVRSTAREKLYIVRLHLESHLDPPRRLLNRDRLISKNKAIKRRVKVPALTPSAKCSIT